MELTTTALDEIHLYSWWWVAVPVVLAVILISVGAALDKEGMWGSGIFVLVLGPFLVAIINLSQPSYDKDLMRTDVAEQLQIEDTIKSGDWYTGRGPDGEYVKFALVEKDGMDDTYAVLVDKGSEKK